MPNQEPILFDGTAESYLKIQEAVKGLIIFGGWEDVGKYRSIRSQQNGRGRIMVRFHDRDKQPWEIMNLSSVKWPACHKRQRFKTREAAMSAVDTYLATLPNVWAVGVKQKGAIAAWERQESHHHRITLELNQ